MLDVPDAKGEIANIGLLGYYGSAKCGEIDHNLLAEVKLDARDMDYSAMEATQNAQEVGTWGNGRKSGGPASDR